MMATREENILLDKMVKLNNNRLDAIAANGYDHDEQERFIGQILLLLDCICEFREPPRALDVEDGYGVMVDKGGEVVG